MMTIGDIGDSAAAPAKAGLASNIAVAVNLAVTVGVDRHKHPVIYWVFGPIPLGMNMLARAAGALLK